MLFSEATGRRVMSIDSASTVGTVSGFLVDPSRAMVVALRVRRSAGTGDTLHWGDLAAFGTDAVTVPSAEAIVDAKGTAAELANKHAEMVGKRVLTDAGAEIGTVTDIDFNPANGAVVAVVTSSGTITGDRLTGCGSYAVVVKNG